MEIYKRLVLAYLAIFRYQETSTRVGLGDDVIEVAKYEYKNRDPKVFEDVHVVQYFHWREAAAWVQQEKQ